MTTLYIIYIISSAFLLALGITTYLVIRQLKKMITASSHTSHEVAVSVEMALKQAVATKATAILRKESRISDLPIQEPDRFIIEKLSKVGEFRVYILVDKGLSEQYLFLESDSGRLISMGNLEDS